MLKPAVQVVPQVSRTLDNWDFNPCRHTKGFLHQPVKYMEIVEWNFNDLSEQYYIRHPE